MTRLQGSPLNTKLILPFEKRHVCALVYRSEDCRKEFGRIHCGIKIEASRSEEWYHSEG